MPFTNADYLPSEEELSVPEIGLSSAPLRAGAHHFGRYCDNQCKEFMLCRQEEKDPRKCIQEGKEVTRCGMDFFQKLKSNCAEEFTKYWTCVDHSSYDMNYSNCKKTQAVFDKCVFDKLHQERPELGYFSKTRVHHTNRAPPGPVNLPLPDATVDPIDTKTAPMPESAGTGHRAFFFN